MNCPQCGQEQFCPCLSCSERNPYKLPKWIHSSEWDISCGKCGLTMNANEWMDLEWEEYKRKRNEKNKTS